MTTRGAAGHWHVPLPLQHLASLSLCWPSFVTCSRQLVWSSPWYQPLIANLRPSIMVCKRAFTCIILFHLHGICYRLKFTTTPPPAPHRHSYFEILAPCDGIRRQGRPEVLSSRGWSAHEWDQCLRKEAPEAPTPLPLCEDTAARLICQPESKPWPHRIPSSLMRFQAPEPGGIHAVGSRRPLGLVTGARGD